MPTPTGLPKRDDIISLNGRKARVIHRTGGDYWSLQVEWIDDRRMLNQQPKGTKQLLVDCPYWLREGNLKIVS